MGDSIPIALSPKKQLRRRSGRLPLPVSSPWGDPSDPLQYDLRRLPKAEREAARRSRTDSSAQKVSIPHAERVQPKPLAPRITDTSIPVQAAPRISLSPLTIQRVTQEKQAVTHSRTSAIPLVTATASLLTSLGLVLALSLLLGRVPLNTALSIPLRSSASEAQAQAFLATLLHLPQISSVSFLTREAQLARAQELSPALPETSLNPFADIVEVSVASLRSEALLAQFLSQSSLQVLLDERLPASFASWEATVGKRTEELRILRQLALLLVSLSLASVLLALSERRTMQLLSS